MTDIFFYSIKVAICLSIAYMFYILALRRLTFYHANRWFLLTGSILSLCIPLVGLIPFSQLRELNTIPSMYSLLIWNNFSDTLSETNQSISFWQAYSNLIIVIFLGGAFIMGSKLLMQVFAFYRIRRSATLLENGLVKIYQIDKPVAPFSFGNHIFLNQHLLEPHEIRQVLEHEQVHVRQKHTIDVLWMECLLIFNWYNPFAWLLRQAIRENLEFIVDREVLLQDSRDKKGYQYLLLKIIGLSHVSIANPFNFSSLKTRIHMMNRKPSKTGATGLYFLVLPLLIVLTFTFCNRTLEDTTSPVEIAEGSTEIPLPQEFLQKNTQLNKLYVQPDGIFVVELKSGKKEEYKLSDKKEASLFEERYGQLPPPPPPIVIKPLGNNVFEVDYNTGKIETYNLNNKSEADIFNKKFSPPQTPVSVPEDEK